MEMKRRKLLVIVALSALLLVIFLAILVSISSPGNMPSYQGKTARQWLNEVFTTNQTAALNAFREMGSNALPILVQAMRKKDSKWDRFYRGLHPKLPGFVRNRVSEPSAPDRDRWSAAQVVLMNVGYAREGKDELIRLMGDTESGRSQY